MKQLSFLMLTNILIISMIGVILHLSGLNQQISYYGINNEYLLGFCAIWGMGGAVINLLLSKFIAKRFYGVEVVSEYEQFDNFTNRVHEIARDAGLKKMPEVGIFDSEEINAFATGPTKNSSLVAFSTALLEQMTPEEMEGVIAHEIAHIANGDMVTMTLITGVMNSFVMFFARILASVVTRSIGSRSFFLRYLLTTLLEFTLGILAVFLVSAFSRHREYKADEGGAKLVGKDKMIKTLQRLNTQYPYLVRDSVNSVSTLKISSKTLFTDVFSSHPSIERRIKALES